MGTVGKSPAKPPGHCAGHDKNYKSYKNQSRDASLPATDPCSNDEQASFYRCESCLAYSSQTTTTLNIIAQPAAILEGNSVVC